MASPAYLHDDARESSDDNQSVASIEEETVNAQSAQGERADNQVNVTGTTRALLILRTALISFWVVVAILVSTGVYMYTSRAEDAVFRKLYYDYAAKVLDAFEVNIQQSLKVLDLLSVTYTSYALDRNLTWPFVTLPDFEIRAIRSIHLVQNGGSIAFGPIVQQDQREQWEAYSVANQESIAQGLEYRKSHPQFYGGWPRTDFGPISIPPVLWELGATNIPTIDNTSGPALPVWQSAPVVYPARMNFNIFSIADVKDSVTAVVEQQKAVLSKVLTIGVDLVSKPTNEPLNIMFYPVFDNFHDRRPRNVVGVIGVEFFWKSYLLRVLPRGADGIIAVLKNTCGQAFTFEVLGEKSRYVGPGDLHDTAFDDMEMVLNMSSIHEVGLAPVDDLGCKHTLRLYPSSTFRNSYVSNRPKVYTAVTASIFVFTAILFLLYDWLVKRRHRVLKQQASRSNAIVVSLFPAQFRERLFRNADSRQLEVSAGGDTRPYNPDAEDQNVARRVGLLSIGIQTPKIKLKTFLQHAASGESRTSCTEDESFGSTPIADLFPHATVLFADIAGFTAWCSQREPTQVLVLLETIFCSFDGLAKRNGVFKVETIGDCYMAVTGLPDPRDDHAVLMATFARACVKKMQKLMKKLEASLGPGTAELSVRIGLHSGPVTAGVLRGDKARFQLFGDTVNTASRMESTGEPGRIHLSEETAALLSAAGKGHWITPRDEAIFAKGKGKLNSYWLTLDEVVSEADALHSGVDLRDGSHEANSDFASKSEKHDDPAKQRIYELKKINCAEWGDVSLDDCRFDQSYDPSKFSRLVEWNVDVLHGRLKAIVAKRNGVECSTRLTENTSRCSDPQAASPREAIAEIIALPCFDPAIAVGTKDPGSVEVGPKIISQLQKYVSAIAKMYRNNPFHNFEHASHVTMSSSKLLQRIVSPDDIDYKRGDMEERHRFTAIASDLHDRTYGIYSDPLAQFAVVFAALVHDVDHLGLTNMQLAQERHPIAIKYYNKSAAEQNAIAKALDLLMSDDFADLRNCICATESEAKRFRQLVVNSVMATDLFDEDLRVFRKNRWDKAFCSTCEFNPDSSSLRDKETDAHLKATAVMEHIIQASDVAHTMQHWHIYQKWNKRFFTELFSSFQRGLMVDDPSLNWYESELSFFDNYVIPLAKKLKDCGAYGVSGDEYLSYAQENRKEWASKGKQIVTLWRGQCKADPSLNNAAVQSLASPVHQPL